MNLYERITMLMKKEKLSHAALEEKLGFSNGSISKWKKSSPTPERLKKVADYFGVSVDYLMNGEEPKEEIYYLDKDAAEIANFLHNNPEYRVLFDSSRKVKPEHIALIKELMDKFSE